MQILAAVVAALAGAFAHVAYQEIRERRRGRVVRSDRGRSIVGEWSGTWWLDEGDDQPPYVSDDSIRITAADDGKVTGEGQDGKGLYTIQGHVSDHGIVSMFYGYRKLTLNGVVILQPSPKADTYNGHWFGYIQEGRVDGGTVTWRRL